MLYKYFLSKTEIVRQYNSDEMGQKPIILRIWSTRSRSRRQNKFSMLIFTIKGFSLLVFVFWSFWLLCCLIYGFWWLFGLLLYYIINCIFYYFIYYCLFWLVVIAFICKSKKQWFKQLFKQLSNYCLVLSYLGAYGGFVSMSVNMQTFI